MQGHWDWEEREGGLLVTRENILSRKRNAMLLPLGEDEFKGRLSAWALGYLIQDAFPMLNADQREFLMTGVTPEEWAATFGEDGDE